MELYDFTRLKRLMLIYKVVQVALLGLLIFMAFNFQQLFLSLGPASLFTCSILYSAGFLLVMFFPVFMLARYDSNVELEASLKGVDDVQLQLLRRKRLTGDLWKLCAMAFFVVFVVIAPDIRKSGALSSLFAAAYLGFLLVSLTYFQLFNSITLGKIKKLP